MGRPPVDAPKTLPVSFRLPLAVPAAVRRAAKDETRSVSSLMERLLTEHLKAKGYLT
ncbi:hypothetical protein ACLBX9_07330 [Methylobacterium sp. A49B]|uniref:hypothetical protein n=1 Tax=Methylobacterium mesophilicum TaxID=39956 RepID=UPI00039E0E16|nr:hypothetical protein [Methylobacterium mesophilicum]MBE7196519.1 hypothetical protein [Parafilimonas terrae]